LVVGLAGSKLLARIPVYLVVLVAALLNMVERVLRVLGLPVKEIVEVVLMFPGQILRLGAEVVPVLLVLRGLLTAQPEAAALE
jgi:hypothetical protein